MYSTFGELVKYVRLRDYIKIGVFCGGVEVDYGDIIDCFPIVEWEIKDGGYDRMSWSLFEWLVRRWVNNKYYPVFYFENGHRVDDYKLCLLDLSDGGMLDACS